MLWGLRAQERVWAHPLGAISPSSGLLPSHTPTALTWHPWCTEVHLSSFHSSCKLAVGTRTKISPASATCSPAPSLPGLDGDRAARWDGSWGGRLEQDSPSERPSPTHHAPAAPQRASCRCCPCHSSQTASPQAESTAVAGAGLICLGSHSTLQLVRGIRAERALCASLF